jgi:hypothetical protein
VWWLFGSGDPALSLTIGLALLECLELLAPTNKDAVDISFSICGARNTALDNHVLLVATDKALREENLDGMLLLEGITVANECVACVDGDGLLDRHVDEES